MKFSGKMWRNIYIKMKKNKVSLTLCRKCKFGKSNNCCQNLKCYIFRDFQVFSFGYRAKLKLGNLRRFLFFLLNPFYNHKFFCLNSFLLFLNLKLKQLSKFQVKGHFPRFLSFRFWVYGKIEKSDTLEGFVFSSKFIS